ncbi:MAG: hypothetical protein H0V39_00330 [Nitrosomonas sp.]|nr:hypothetical protein [Nitrosomonas sp.]
MRQISFQGAVNQDGMKLDYIFTHITIKELWLMLILVLDRRAGFMPVSVIL